MRQTIRDKLRAAFYQPEQLHAPQSTQQVTEEAAREFARLAEQLRDLLTGFVAELVQVRG